MANVTNSSTVSFQAQNNSVEVRSRGYWAGVFNHLKYDHFTLFFVVLALVIVLAAVFAPWLGLPDPFQTSMARRLKPIGFNGHLLGTDELGRDLFSRLVYGGRTSLLLGIIPVVLATFIGGLLGVIAGFFGRGVNMLIMRVMDVFYAFPSVLLAVAISGTLGGGILNGLIALTLVFIPSLCRIAESATVQIRALDYIEAARATGASNWSVIRTHVIGNVLTPVLVYASSLISVAVLLGAGLSFLGLGVEPPTPDWGQMLSSLRQSIYVQPLICALPGLAIFLTSLSFNFISDGFRRAMDIKA